MNTFSLFSNVLGVSPVAIGLIVVWTMIWKGLALWRSAGLRQKWWFIALLVVNTMGILEILYLYVFSRGYKVEVVEEK